MQTKTNSNWAECKQIQIRVNAILWSLRFHTWKPEWLRKLLNFKIIVLCMIPNFRGLTKVAKKNAGLPVFVIQKLFSSFQVSRCKYCLKTFFFHAKSLGYFKKYVKGFWIFHESSILEKKLLAEYTKIWTCKNIESVRPVGKLQLKYFIEYLFESFRIRKFFFV